MRLGRRADRETDIIVSHLAGAGLRVFPLGGGGSCIKQRGLRRALTTRGRSVRYGSFISDKMGMKDSSLPVDYQS